MPMIKLQSSDGEVFDVDVEIAKASNTIKTMIEGLERGRGEGGGGMAGGMIPSNPTESPLSVHLFLC